MLSGSKTTRQGPTQCHFLSAYEAGPNNLKFIPVVFISTTINITNLPLIMKYLFQLMFGPPNVRLEASKLPNTIHISVLDGGFSVGMTFVHDLGELIIAVFLMRHPHLMVARDFALGRLDPFSGPHEMLRLDAFVSKELLA